MRFRPHVRPCSRRRPPGRSRRLHRPLHPLHQGCCRSCVLVAHPGKRCPARECVACPVPHLGCRAEALAVAVGKCWCWVEAAWCLHVLACVQLGWTGSYRETAAAELQSRSMESDTAVRVNARQSPLGAIACGWLKRHWPFARNASQFTLLCASITAWGAPLGAPHAPRAPTCFPPESRHPVGREAPQHAHVAHHAAVAGPQQQALDQAALRGAQPRRAVHCRQGGQLRVHAHRDRRIAQRVACMHATQMGACAWQPRKGEARQKIDRAGCVLLPCTPLFTNVAWAQGNIRRPA